VALLAKAKALLESLDSSGSYGHISNNDSPGALTPLENTSGRDGTIYPDADVDKDADVSNMVACRASACEVAGALSSRGHIRTDSFLEASQRLNDETPPPHIEKTPTNDLATAIREVVQLNDRQVCTTTSVSREANRYFGLML
jgi:hypothetical protein